MKDYWRMSNEELEKEASRFHVGEYADRLGGISRERIIEQLIKKDAAEEMPKASLRSWIALGVSIASVIISLLATFLR